MILRRRASPPQDHKAPRPGRRFPASSGGTPTSSMSGHGFLQLQLATVQGNR
jgi:hypothetical protein